MQTMHYSTSSWRRQLQQADIDPDYHLVSSDDFEDDRSSGNSEYHGKQRYMDEKALERLSACISDCLSDYCEYVTIGEVPEGFKHAEKPNEKANGNAVDWIEQSLGQVHHIRSRLQAQQRFQRAKRAELDEIFVDLERTFRGVDSLLKLPGHKSSKKLPGITTLPISRTTQQDDASSNSDSPQLVGYKLDVLPTPPARHFSGGSSFGSSFHSSTNLTLPEVTNISRDNRHGARPVSVDSLQSLISTIATALDMNWDDLEDIAAQLDSPHLIPSESWSRNSKLRTLRNKFKHIKLSHAKVAGSGEIDELKLRLLMAGIYAAQFGMALEHLDQRYFRRKSNYVLV